MKLTDRIHLCGSGAFGLSPEGDCHCYALDAADELALIDCGLARDPAALLENLERDGLDPRRLTTLLLTHAHPDHAGACAWLREHMGVRILTSEWEADALENGLLETLGLDPAEPALAPFRDMARLAPDGVLRDGQRLEIGDLAVTALLTPGHTAGSLCFEVATGGKTQLFSGDEVFYRGFVSVLAPPLSDYAGYRRGLERLRDRNVDGLFPAHLMWTLRGGQRHIDTALRNFTEGQRPELKPFS